MVHGWGSYRCRSLYAYTRLCMLRGKDVQNVYSSLRHGCNYWLVNGGRRRQASQPSITVRPCCHRCFQCLRSQLVAARSLLGFASTPDDSEAAVPLIRNERISILLGFPGQVVLPGAINCCVRHIRNEDICIFVQDEASVAQKLEGFRCPRDSRGVRYYVLTHCSLSAQFCMSIHFIFLRSSSFFGIPDAGSTAVGCSQVDAQAVTTSTSVCVSLKRQNCSQNLWTVELADLTADAWWWTCSGQCGAFILWVWIVRVEFCNIRLLGCLSWTQSPFSHLMSREWG